MKLLSNKNKAPFYLLINVLKKSNQNLPLIYFSSPSGQLTHPKMDLKQFWKRRFQAVDDVTQRSGS